MNNIFAFEYWTWYSLRHPCLLSSLYAKIIHTLHRRQDHEGVMQIEYYQEDFRENGILSTSDEGDESDFGVFLEHNVIS